VTTGLFALVPVVHRDAKFTLEPGALLPMSYPTVRTKCGVEEEKFKGLTAAK